MQRKKRILIAPLDWGLGHTTRCMPLMQWLIQHNHTPVFAGAAKQIAFIQQSFPEIECHTLGGYDITYAKGRLATKLKLAAQVNTITASIKQEQQWLQSHAAHLHLDGIISDNRFGLFHQNIPAVILTHQVNVQSGWGRLGNALSQWQNKKWLSRFSQQWIVDVADPHLSLAGTLSHPAPPSAQYIGWLSPYAALAQPSSSRTSILILLSGPEPQRTLLSDQLFAWAIQQKEKIIFVEGSNEHPRNTIPDHIQYHQRITPSALAPMMQAVQFVICRSGYSTLMDLLAMGTPAWLIPTQGQAEQEYLAQYLDGKMGFKKLRSLSENIEAPVAPSSTLSAHFSLFEKTIKNWIERI